MRLSPFILTTYTTATWTPLPFQKPSSWNWCTLLLNVSSSALMTPCTCKLTESFWGAPWEPRYRIYLLGFRRRDCSKPSTNHYFTNRWRCPWCNGYRHRIWTRRYEFNSWTRLISFHIALIPLGKVWIQLFSLQLWVNSRTD